ncbi:MAG: class I SAM-dependent methyltransferase [Bacteroidetes bacterium]|nr:class I SAM-dependent methyltransferase [Bacteroidota bacterium]
MNPEKDYIAINKQSWNKRTELHIHSDFYQMPEFLAGKSSLNAIELELLGDIRGKKILHLQCHFGQDSLSMQRMGAMVTGVDFSDKAIAYAETIADQSSLDAHFVCCNLYDLPMHLNEEFDIVFTSYGTIGWLPDLSAWAKIIAQFLKPNGKFIMVEFHPVVWMFDNEFKTIAYSYFKSDAIVESLEGTYADRDADLILDTVSWNHALAEVTNSLTSHNMVISHLDEINYSPYNCFQNTIETSPQRFQIKGLEDKIPMVYSLVAKKEMNLF